MEAGHELDALIAEKVMGLEVARGCRFKPNYETEKALNSWVEPKQDEYFTPGKIAGWRESYSIIRPGITVRRPDDNEIAYHDACPEYSTDITAAWEVVEKMSSYDFDVSISLSSKLSSDDLERWYCDMTHGDDNAPWREDYKFIQVWAPTAPHAICLAALSAVCDAQN